MTTHHSEGPQLRRLELATESCEGCQLRKLTAVKTDSREDCVAAASDGRGRGYHALHRMMPHLAESLSLEPSCATASSSGSLPIRAVPSRAARGCSSFACADCRSAEGVAASAEVGAARKAAAGLRERVSATGMEFQPARAVARTTSRSAVMA